MTLTKSAADNPPRSRDMPDGGQHMARPGSIVARRFGLNAGPGKRFRRYESGEQRSIVQAQMLGSECDSQSSMPV